MTVVNLHPSPQGIAAHDLMEMSIDRQKQHPYTPSVEKGAVG
jgi:hypothetical protein